MQDDEDRIMPEITMQKFDRVHYNPVGMSIPNRLPGLHHPSQDQGFSRQNNSNNQSCSLPELPKRSFLGRVTEIITDE